MELQLALALPTSVPSKGLSFDLNDGEVCSANTTTATSQRKRHFTDAIGGDAPADSALPLFSCASTQGDSRNSNGRGGRGLNADDEAEFGNAGGVVGWPPVKSAWRNFGGSGGASRYVKVKMEGVAIGRKVDLALHRSYTTLLDALDGMFTGKHEVEMTGLDGAGQPAPPPSNRHRTFTYEDCDGDWMLLGDVPWEDFVKSVKRIKILSCGE